MTRFLVAILAATTTSAFKTPKSRALKVRGGIDIQKVGTALIGLEGLVGMIAPETACKNYGHSPSADDIQFKRYTSAWLAALAMLLSSDAMVAVDVLTFQACVVAIFCSFARRGDGASTVERALRRQSMDVVLFAPLSERHSFFRSITVLS